MTYNGGDKIAVTPFSQYPLPTQCPSAELSRAFAVISNHLPKANTTDFWCREFLPLPIPREPRCWFNADFRLHLGKVGWRLGWAGGLCLLSSSCQPLFFCFFSVSPFLFPSSFSTKPVQGKGAVVQYSNPEPRQEARAGRSCTPSTGGKKGDRGRF